jgi:CRP-like cAMP-binding protein
MRPGVVALAALPLFQRCSASQIAKLNEVADLARVGPDETLFHEGDRVHDFNYLLAGFVLKTCVWSNEQVPVDVISPVKPVGFASAMLECASPMSAKTITSARLIIIPAHTLRTMIRARGGPVLKFFDHALARLVEQQSEICNLKLRTATQRLAIFLLGQIDQPEMQSARLTLPYERSHLAAKIGCSQEHLSRAFGVLRTVGVVTERGVLIVRDVSALRTFAGLPGKVVAN